MLMCSLVITTACMVQVCVYNLNLNLVTGQAAYTDGDQPKRYMHTYTNLYNLIYIKLYWFKFDTNDSNLIQ